jgi:pimeloyl-ACP methyl ester carboxylesterase
VTRVPNWLCLVPVLAACANGRDARPNAERLAASGGLRRLDIQANPFHLVAYARFGAAPVLRIYIEGDGHAWTNRNTPSDDPTPWSPVALEFALRDPAPSVAYLARPCQYVAPGSDPACQPYYWTDGRYAEPAIASANAAVDRLLAESGARAVELVGYSGGGAVAALVAARRHDIVNLLTVAANLDTSAWTAREGLSPLTGSLNPADFPDRLQNIPQLHFMGDDDSVVHTTIARAYASRFRRLHCVRMEIVPSVGHGDGWLAHWPTLPRRPIACEGS